MPLLPQDSKEPPFPATHFTQKIYSCICPMLGRCYRVLRYVHLEDVHSNMIVEYCEDLSEGDWRVVSSDKERSFVLKDMMEKKFGF